MFRCNHCKTEYGGIRGVTADNCPRCVARYGIPAREPSASAIAPSTDWRQSQLFVPMSWSLPATAHPAR